MKKLLFLSFIVLSTNIFAADTLGKCEYGVSDKDIYIKGGNFVDSMNEGLMSADMYSCSDKYALALMKLNIVFTEFGAFLQWRIQV
ncbi:MULTISPECIES: hypothetical protein [Pasteurellaceae]|uniref:Uncharacterized protein n=1 Tax=Pasteurella atlantica TaxID=2827233 RepID=A0AAW8CT00_9PAST|nr:hypothetical protein [Pasteurella atlantica]MBR0574590.1 hypothetical protein [Pasteurella atlantica]MDP8040486.1 hypothetical protein [Pasteurella atlantica]MDP8042627.1 hypothetical protein [Pasteurella atlantica]MDP8044741.1 hypothetical protein [Pasteurella atlantica]MDP8046813.1 hypothetical protein [Pasteurella atlantica]